MYLWPRTDYSGLDLYSLDEFGLALPAPIEFAVPVLNLTPLSFLEFTKPDFLLRMNTDVPGDITTSESLTLGGSVQGTDDSDNTTIDEDWYRFDAEAGQVVFFAIEDTNSFDSEIIIYDSNGVELVRSGTLIIPYELAFEFPSTGEFFVSAALFGDPGGSYTLSASEVADDYSDDTQTTGEIEVNGQASGVLESAYDSDWFRISVVEGFEYTISYSGTATFGLRNADGTQNTDSDYTGDNFGSGQLITFIATETGDMFVELSAIDDPDAGFYEYPENYFLDFTSSDANNAPFIVDGETLFSLDIGSGSQVVRIDVEAGETIVLLLEGTDLFFASMELVDADGNLIDFSNDDNFGTLNLEHTFAAGGTYDLRISNGNGSSGDFFDLSRIDNPQDAGGQNAPELIDIGDSVIEGFSGPDDIDAFRFTASENAIVDISFNGLASSDMITIYDSLGNDVTDQAQTSGNLDFTFTAIDSGDYTIVLDPYDSFGGDYSRYYTVSLSQSADRHAEGVTTGSSIAIGGTQSGTLNTEIDQDWFAVSLIEGEGYRFTINWDPALAVEDQVPALDLYDADGNLLTDFNSNAVTYIRSDVDGFATIIVPGPASGTYYLSANDFNALISNPLDYTLSADIILDDFGGAARPGQLPAGLEGSISGQLDFFGDTDWFEIDVTAGETFAFFIEGLSVVNTNFILHNVDGTQTVMDQNSPYIFLEATQSGTAYVEVVSNSNFGDRIEYPADYTVRFVEVIDAVPDTQATALTFNPGDVITDSLTAGDEDWLTFDAEAGDIIQFTFGAAEWSGAFGLILHDSNGETYALTEDVLEVLISGTFYIQILDYLEADYLDYTIAFADPDNIIDVLSDFDDAVFYTEFDDIVYGLRGDDTILGLQGNDTIYAGDGNDTLVGGEGQDDMTGGRGRDLFVFDDNGDRDRIRDFDVAEDVIMFNGDPFTGLDGVSFLDRANYIIVIFENGTSVRLDGVNSSDLTDANFLVSGDPDNGLNIIRKTTDLPLPEKAGDNAAEKSTDTSLTAEGIEDNNSAQFNALAEVLTGIGYDAAELLYNQGTQNTHVTEALTAAEPNGSDFIF